MQVLIVGEGPVADGLTPMLAALGWDARTATTLVDAESAIPSADAVVVTSRHEDVDGPAIRAALAAGTPYVGAMGSRRTQARRRGAYCPNGRAPGSSGNAALLALAHCCNGREEGTAQR
jgi:xanthine dehydrogenase accessory factor